MGKILKYSHTVGINMYTDSLVKQAFPCKASSDLKELGESLKSR